MPVIPILQAHYPWSNKLPEEAVAQGYWLQLHILLEPPILDLSRR
jgi:hypothetical protein